MLVPFIQGTMRYLYKTKSAVRAKEAGELFAFASAVLPFIDAVDPAAADMLFHRAWGLDFTDATYSYDQIKTAIEGTYSKLGMGAGVGTISCADIGDLGSATSTLAAGCVDSTSSSSGKRTMRHRDSPGRHRAHRRDIRRGHVPKERITQQARRRVNRAAARRSRSRVGEVASELSEPPTRARLPRDFLLHINQSINQSILF